MPGAGRLFVLLLSAFAVLVLPSGGRVCADDDDQFQTPLNRAATRETAGHHLPPDGGLTLELSRERQQLGGLRTERLAAHTQGEETLAYGRVMDIRPLLELRSRYRSAQSELAIAEAALRVAKKNHDRLARLHVESIIPTRDFIQAESQLAADEAREQAALRHIREVREEVLQTWGEELFHQAVEGESPLFQGLLTRSLVLVLIALPANESLPDKVVTVGVAPSGDRDRARKSRLVSPAPRTEESTQGETWFFVAEPSGLRTGMRLDAWIPRAGRVSSGVLVPLSCVVWRDGLPWIYVRNGPESFVRRAIGFHREHGNAWFVPEGFSPGDEVVVVGSQMLLSEEQRRRGSATTEDDD